MIDGATPNPKFRLKF